MVRIRLATKSDADAMAAIYAPFVEQSAVSFEIVPPIPDEISRRIVETTMAYPWLVCEMNEVVVGYAYATQHRVRAAYRWSVDTSAYIAAAYHRRGIGRALYASLFEILRAQGFFNAYAGITLPNVASVRLHEAVGFRQIGIHQKVGHKLGRWHDVGWWQLALRAHPQNPHEPLALSAIVGSQQWERLVSTGEGSIR
jgi:phosphinothricin acetyltransferase